MKYYDYQKIRENLYLIFENYAEDSCLTMGLVIGSARAALIDSGMGLFGSELADLVASLTDRPIVNLLTHGHPDHIAGSVLFEEVFMNQRDLDQIPRLVPEKRLKDAAFFSHDDEALTAYARTHCLDCSVFRCRNIDEEETVDLGGICLEVIKLPGHSMGSLAFFNAADGYVFVGDAFNTRVPASVIRDPEQFSEMADAIRLFLARVPEGTVMYGGHWREPLARQTAVDEMHAAEEIAAGEISDDESIYIPISPVPNQKRHIHGTVGISYNPAIFAEKELQEGLEVWNAGDDETAEKHFQKADSYGHMKAGRYLAVLALKRAAERGDITSKLILGTLSEFGYALPCDMTQAEKWYLSALADDHPNKEGFMLAAGADLGMGRIRSLCGDTGQAREYLAKAVKGGEPQVRAQAEKWLEKDRSDAYTSVQAE